MTPVALFNRWAPPIGLGLALMLAGVDAAAAAPASPAETDVCAVIGSGGVIPAGTVWNAEGSPYIVTCTLRVETENSSLRVENGAVVKFAENGRLQVKGAFTVAGTTPAGVEFTSNKTSPKAGDWSGIDIQENATVVIEGATVRYAITGLTISAAGTSVRNSVIEKSSKSGVVVNRVDGVTIAGTVMQDNATYGVEFNDRTDMRAVATLDGNTYTRNTLAAVRQRPNIQLIISGSRASGNGVNGILLETGISTGPSTFYGGDLPYVIASSWYTSQDLTIEPGTVIKFTTGSGSPSSGLRLDAGRLSVNGSADKKVYFTSIVDDTACTSTLVDCDTNNDGASTQPLSGLWMRVELRANSTGATITHTEFRYGSDDMFKVETNNVSVADSLFTQSRGDAMLVNNSSIQVQACRFTDNAGVGIRMATTNSTHGLMTLTLAGSTFERNAMPVTFPPDVALVNSGNQATGNQLNGYVVSAGSVTAPHVWRAGDLPFVIADGATVDLSESDSTLPLLALEPGVVVKMGRDAQILATSGGLKTGDKNATAKVLITSLKDDACSAADTARGCDTNNGGGEPSAGDWNRIEAKAGSDGLAMFHTVVRYGGGTLNAAIETQSGNTLIEHVEVSHSASTGIRVKAVEAIKLVNCWLHDNKGSGVAVAGGLTAIRLIFEGNTVENNGGAAVEMDANSILDLDDPDTPGRQPNIIRGNGLNAVAVKGTMTKARVWQPLDGISYVVNGNIDVAQGITFEIRPGVVVKLDGAKITTSAGSLVLEGTAEKPIFLTSIRDDSVGGDVRTGDGSPGPGDWSGVVFDDTAKDPPNPAEKPRVIWTELRYAGANSAPAVTIEKKGVPVRHTVIRDGRGPGVRVLISPNSSAEPIEISDTRIERMLGDGIHVTSQGSTPVEPIIERNTINGCQAAIRLSANVEATLSANPVADNLINGVVVEGTVTVLRRWLKNNLAFVLLETVDVGSGGTLEIQAGAVVKADTDVYLRAQKNSTLLIAGTDRGGPVVLTSLRDDVTGCPAGTPTTDPSCDTNGDGDRTGPRPGDWRGVDAAPEARNVKLTQVRLFYGDNKDAAIVIRAGGSVVEKSEIAYAGLNGITVDITTVNASPATIRDNLIHHNIEGAGLELRGTGGATIEGNRFTDNDRSIILRATGLTVTLNNVAVGNVHDPMLVKAAVKANQEWLSDLVREVDSSLSVDPNVTLDIRPGTVVLFTSLGGLRVAHELRAEGAIFASTERSPIPANYWSGITFLATSTGWIKNSVFMLGGKVSGDGAINVQSSLNNPVDVLYNTMLDLGSTAIGFNGNKDRRSRIEGNLIRELRGSSSVGISLKAGAVPNVANNRLAGMLTGISASGKSMPVIGHNNFSELTANAVANSDSTVCVEARQNWWADSAGPNDKDDIGTRDPCGDKIINLNVKGLNVTNNVRYEPYLKLSPPAAPLVDLPICGVTNKSSVEVRGTAGPGSRVQILDDGQEVGQTVVGPDGRFRADLTLGAGPRKLSFQSSADIEGTSVTSARTGFRVVTVDRNSPVDPAGIRFEYGPPGSARLQPVRDIAGCSTACGGPTSGRVTLPPDTDMRVRIEGSIDGAPSRVVFVQPGLEVDLVNEGAYWRTRPFRPLQGSFTIKVDGSKATDCMGYIYLGSTGIVFADSGAPGSPVVAAGFEIGEESWTGEGDWIRTPFGFDGSLLPDPPVDPPSALDWSFANAGVEVDAEGKPVLGPDGNPIKKKYRPSQDVSLGYGVEFALNTVAAPQLMFWHQLRLARGDTAYIELRLAGSSSWTNVKTYTGTVFDGWRAEIIPLDKFAAERRVQLRFRLKTDADAATVDTGWYVDDIVVGPGGMNNGRYDPGEPRVADASVTLRQRNPDTGVWIDWDATPTGQSNPQITGTDGSYGFYNLPAGEYRLMVTHPLYGVHTLDLIPIWDGTYSVNIALRGSTPLYLPIAYHNPYRPPPTPTRTRTPTGPRVAADPRATTPEPPRR